ncbi:MAG: 30S ribosomal protein S8 [Pseudomonadota bacterium]|nr:30S ribosomal protein S8 [Pseudomonadota bacterium]MDE3037869.1 30S ribosomal protein S8 [Pseudomonadota bacterium]
MSMNYRLADMLALIKNGQQARLARIHCQASQLLGNVLDVLKTEGFIGDYRKVETDQGKSQFEIDLKYHEGESVIRKLVCISTPGRRVYCKISRLPKYYNGLGIAILSTSKGVMSDFDARQAGVGGEVLCSVF